jgi:putative chitinase
MNMLLKIGSSGDDVKRVQARLGLDPNGSFGTETELKVKEWQTENNLDPDGKIGDLSWKALFPGEQALASDNAAVSFKLENLLGHIPPEVIAQIPETAAKFNINSVLKLAHFLAQCSHESGGYKDVFEKLNYSEEGLQKTFGKYFPARNFADYAHKPAAIASHVYANKNGNGDEASGEGYKFRGRGYIQLTGKNNYTAFAKFVGEDTVANPDLVATKYPLSSAAFFFSDNKIWSLCDKGSSEEVITAVTKRINGGVNGLAERIKYFNEFFNLLK